MTKRVLTIFGTRPEAIKMAPVVQMLESSADIESKLAVTAQHREMLDQVLDLFELVPDYDLDIMKDNQDLFDITSKSLLGLREIIKDSKPDIVLVHGDTTTCFTAALAAFYCEVPVGHVEAGLRSQNLYAPYPEEANRSLVGRIATFHFAPTETARQNLLAENVTESSIVVTGNTVIDALLQVHRRVSQYDPYIWAPDLPETTIKASLSQHRKMILITGHRRENFGQGFIDFCNALKEIAGSHPDWLLVYPVHLNPNVQAPVNELLGDLDNIHLIKPQNYLPFVWLLSRCDLVITDSGGIQEEAPSLGKPVLVTREVTERPEAVEAGTVRLVGTAPDRIVSNTVEILNDESIYRKMSNAHNPYGDGNAAERILRHILNHQ